MKAQFEVHGYVLEDPILASFTVDTDAVPRVGDVVTVPVVGETYVRTVVWYPRGEDPQETAVPDPTPFVYVALGPPR